MDGHDEANTLSSICALSWVLSLPCALQPVFVLVPYLYCPEEHVLHELPDRYLHEEQLTVGGDGGLLQLLHPQFWHGGVHGLPIPQNVAHERRFRSNKRSGVVNGSSNGSANVKVFSRSRTGESTP